MKHLLLGAGFIGGETARQLREADEYVRIMDRRPVDPEIAHEVICPGEMQHQGDLAVALPGMDVVHIYGGEMGFTADWPRYWINPTNVANVCFMISKLPAGNRPTRLVLASSQAVYGDRQKLPCAEHHELLGQLSPYGLSKLHSEEVAQSLCAALGIELVCLRYSIVVGAGQRWQSPYTGVVRAFAASVIHQVPPLIFQDGEQLRDYVSVSDVGRANCMAAMGILPAGTYNVGGDTLVTVNQVWDAVAETAEECHLRPERPGVHRAGDVRHMYSDSEKLTAYGWEPEVSWRDALKAFLGWAALSDAMPAPPDPATAIAELSLRGELVEWETESSELISEG